ncbi:MAG TPA: cysteine--tRNA ligase [Anaerolineales bacterium]|nr:cysteine--tRNA ligase [Anaerolineales bacterium]
MREGGAVPDRFFQRLNKIMTLRIYNSLSRAKEPFETLEPGSVRMYVCGPTVYDDAHVGHAMSVVVFDVIRRYLEYRGYKVVHVMNYTDVDDKIIRRANEMGINPFVLADQYIVQFKDHLADLNVLPPTIAPQATGEIEHIIEMNLSLIEKGCAYAVDGDVYFRVRERPDYGKLSGRKLEDMQAGARIEIDERKEHPMDFALWKAAKEGEPAWESPWGSGRPGWHIECSAMSMAHLGPQIDIHGGGNDLVFPHHENEIAQTESLTGKPFSRYWVHNGMLQLDGEKMSKSVGNLVTIQQFLEDHEADVFRLIVLNSSYRGPLTFTGDVVEQAKKALARLRSALKPAAGESGLGAEPLAEQVERTRTVFQEAMDDDFNTAGALAGLFDLVRAINAARDAGVEPGGIAAAQAALLELSRILGLKLETTPADETIDPFIDLLLEVRKALRAARLWELSDLVRDRLVSLGIVVEDSKDGSIWYRE